MSSATNPNHTTHNPITKQMKMHSEGTSQIYKFK